MNDGHAMGVQVERGSIVADGDLIDASTLGRRAAEECGRLFRCGLLELSRVKRRPPWSRRCRTYGLGEG